MPQLQKAPHIFCANWIGPRYTGYPIHLTRFYRIHSVSESNRTQIALFNYGGGLRGLIPAYIMARIEDVTGLRMTDMVDIFAGPSTGSILNAALNLRHPEHPEQPKYRARHMVRFYEREGARIFPADSFREMRGLIHDFNNRTMKLNQLNWLFKHGHYDPSNLGHALQALFGTAQLSDSLRSLIIPCYNIDGDGIEAVTERGETGNSPVHTKNNFINEGGHALWLKSMRTGTPAEHRINTPHVSLYDAVMASCAAPTYFPCHHFPATLPGDSERKYYSAIDGCIFDNPCISYLGAIRQHIQPSQNLKMIVLGTGYTNKSIKRDEWNRFGALGVVDPVNDLPLINIFFNASESALMDSFAAEMGDNLYIFNKSLHAGRHGDFPSIQIDDASPENMNRLRLFFEAIMEENARTFDEVCHILVSNRDRRSDEDRSKRKEGILRYFVSMFDGRDSSTDRSLDD